VVKLKSASASVIACARSVSVSVGSGYGWVRSIVGASANEVVLPASSMTVNELSVSAETLPALSYVVASMLTTSPEPAGESVKLGATVAAQSDQAPPFCW